MAPSLETIDNLPPVQPRDRVTELDRSKEEQDQEAFKKALKRKMQQQANEDDNAEDDALIVDIDLSKREQEHSGDAAAETEGPDDAAEPEPNEETGDTDQSPAPPDHIDLKA